MRGLNLNCVLEAIRGLPALPETYVQVMQMSKDPAVRLSDIATAINSDMALAAKVLQVANTPFYGMNGRIETVPRALVILGSKTVCSLALGAGIVEALHEQDPRAECGIDVWKHCLQTAIAARELAEYNGTIDPDVAFAAGLLHDVGKLVLATLFPEHYRNVLDEHAATCVPLVELENRIFGIDHARVGATLCKTWNLPRTLEIALGNHHGSPADAMSIAIAGGNVLARLVAPHASGEVHVSTAELTSLLSDRRNSDRVKRLVVSQSMQPPVSLGSNGETMATVAIDIKDPTLRETISLVSLACGYTPVEFGDEPAASVGICDTAPENSNLPVVLLGKYLTSSATAQLLNVAALHRTLLLCGLTEDPAARDNCQQELAASVPSTPVRY